MAESIFKVYHTVPNVPAEFRGQEGTESPVIIHYDKWLVQTPMEAAATR